MPWSGTEHLEPFPTGNEASVMVGSDDMFVAASSLTGTYGAGYYSIFHIPTRTSRLFSGLAGSARRAAASANGKAWTTPTAAGLLQSVDISTGGITSHGTWTGGATRLIGVGSSYIAGGTRIFNIGTNTLSAAITGLANGRLGVLGSRLFAADNTNYIEFDPATGAQIATWAHGASSVDGDQIAVELGGRLHWMVRSGSAQAIGWLDPVAGTTGIVAFTPPMPGTIAPNVVELGGTLWVRRNPGGGADLDLVGVDPVAGTWSADTFSTVRSHRGQLLAAAGKLWVPSGDPIT